jgi:hypothetical protein
MATCPEIRPEPGQRDRSAQPVVDRAGDRLGVLR